MLLFNGLITHFVIRKRTRKITRCNFCANKEELKNTWLNIIRDQMDIVILIKSAKSRLVSRFVSNVKMHLSENVIDGCLKTRADAQSGPNLKNKQPRNRSVTAKQMQINDTSIATLMTMMNQNSDERACGEGQKKRKHTHRRMDEMRAESKSERERTLCCERRGDNKKQRAALW